ncbi:MAG: hypothetical protein F4Y03_04140 [Alphaproteobacteria bacterium]|nr:hypothetical protein [Alphaproteobacteria bacterium]
MDAEPRLHGIGRHAREGREHGGRQHQRAGEAGRRDRRSLGREDAVPDAARSGAERKAGNRRLLRQRLRRDGTEREGARRPLPEGGRADARGDERSGKLADRKARLSVAPGRLFRPGLEARRGRQGGNLLQKGAHRRVARNLACERIPLRTASGLRMGQLQQFGEQPPFDLARDIGDEHPAAPAQPGGNRFAPTPSREPGGRFQSEVGAGQRHVGGRAQQVPPDCPAVQFQGAPQAEIALDEIRHHVPAAADIALHRPAHRRVGLFRPEIWRKPGHCPNMGRPDRERETAALRTDSFAPPGAELCVRLGPNPSGRDLVVGDLHGHFPTLRRALAELEFDERDRLISLGDLIDRGPASVEAKSWIEGNDPAARFDLVLRGNHEQLMLEALQESGGSLARGALFGNAWRLWQVNGGGWWNLQGIGEDARAWTDLLASLPFTAQVETRSGPVGLVHACPVRRRWQDLEDSIRGDGPNDGLVRTRALWSRVYHGWLQREIGEAGDEYLGPVEGVRAVLTGHTSTVEPRWRENVLGIDTGVHIDRPGYGRLTIARIDGKEIETRSFER